tara:strand:- start:485 stop:589 length:105 start_codon:yes stop_codon:yes gene_type:complete
MSSKYTRGAMMQTSKEKFKILNSLVGTFEVGKVP